MHQPNVERSVNTLKINHIGEWTCLCGNRADGAGFYPCNSDGETVEPTADAWTTNWYVCNRCGRMIDQETGQIVGCRFNNQLTPAERQAIMVNLKRNNFPIQASS